MNRTSNIGLIHCGHDDTFYEVKNNVSLQSRIIKVYAPKKQRSLLNNYYPAAEIVNEMTTLLHDENIEHVIISKPAKEDLHLVAKVLQAGKKVQIINN
jgi:hypothetical protein